MASHRKPSKLVPLAVVLGVLFVAAFGAYAVAGIRGSAVHLASASGTSGRDAG